MMTDAAASGGDGAGRMLDDEFSSKTLLKIRTITCFVHLAPDIKGESPNDARWRLLLLQHIDETLARAAHFLKAAQRAFVTSGGYSVQTLRIATNPFGEWLVTEPHHLFADTKAQLQHLDTVLATHGIEFCALGPATTTQQVQDICPLIVAKSHRLSCSAVLHANDVIMARACASTIQSISRLGNTPGSAAAHVSNGLGNFRFCVAANCSNKTSIPFFPVAATCSSSSSGGGSDHDDKDGSPTTTSGLVGFAIGLENGVLANRLLAQCGSIQHISTVFKSGMHRVLLPIQAICKDIEKNATTTNGHGGDDRVFQFLGIDTSLNPSLVDANNGSIAAAIEQLPEVAVFGGPGTIAAAAAITTCLQSLNNDITCTGYCGLMLPVCEDQRLVQLASGASGSKEEEEEEEERRRCLQIPDLLSISSVCGVGIDTVPIAGDDVCQQQQQELTSLLLDVAGLAERWDKSLSCRVLPMPGKKVGDVTTFASSYMMNTKVMSLI
jgi:uncharacterized protein